MLDAQFQDDFLLKNKKPKAGIFPVSISCVNELGVYGGAWRHESLELIELRDPKAKITQTLLQSRIVVELVCFFISTRVIRFFFFFSFSDTGHTCCR